MFSLIKIWTVSFISMLNEMTNLYPYHRHHRCGSEVEWKWSSFQQAGQLSIILFRSDSSWITITRGIGCRRPIKMPCEISISYTSRSFLWEHLEFKVFEIQPTSLGQLLHRVVFGCQQFTREFSSNVGQAFWKFSQLKQ